MALLLLANVRHQQDWLGRHLSTGASLTMRLLGFGLLALAFAGAGAGLGWAYGTVAWFGWLSLAATLVATANSNRERLSGPYGRGKT